MFLSHYISKHYESKLYIFPVVAWFSIMPKLKNIKSLGHKFKGVVKISHQNFPKTYMDNTVNNFRGVTYLVMNSYRKGYTTYAIGYKYNPRRELIFIFTDGTG